MDFNRPTEPNERSNKPPPKQHHFLTIGLGHALDLVLLLDRVRVAAAARGIDQFLGQTLAHGL